LTTGSIAKVKACVPALEQPWCKIAAESAVREIMKRIAACILLLAALSATASIPAQAQRTSTAENMRRSGKEAKQQKQVLKKMSKKQRKAMKKYEKAQRKAAKANRRTR
jgi:Skp family chaperone for outer membrane proteins